MNIAQIRRYALSLPEVNEEPHHHFSSFRVDSKIFVTVPPDEKYVHIFLTEEHRDLALALGSEYLEKLFWGGKLVGLRITLAKAPPAMVKRLVFQAWSRKASKTLLASVAGTSASTHLTSTVLPRKRENNSADTMKVAAIESQIVVFLGKYSEAIESQLRDARSRLRAMFPNGFELVFDNYNALVFSISASESRSGAFLSVAGYPRWVTLFFLNGVDLKDPNGLLVGQGKQVRSIRLKEASDIDNPSVQALITQAIAPYKLAFSTAPAITTLIKSEVGKQRARRPVETSTLSLASIRQTKPK